MKIQRIIPNPNQKNQPEFVDINFIAAQGSTITTGFPIAFTTTAASNDGALAVLPATTNVRTFAGISLSDVPDNGLGFARAYGFVNSVRIFATGTSVTNAAEVAIGPAAASLGVNSTGLVFAYGPVVSMESIGAAINSPGGWAKGFVRAL